MSTALSMAEVKIEMEIDVYQMEEVGHAPVYQHSLQLLQ